LHGSLFHSYSCGAGGRTELNDDDSYRTDTAIISPLFIHLDTIPASKGEPVVLIPIDLNDLESIDGAINAPGIDGGEV
jgi:hypothetical protein